MIQLWRTTAANFAHILRFSTIYRAPMLRVQAISMSTKKQTEDDQTAETVSTVKKRQSKTIKPPASASKESTGSVSEIKSEPDRTSQHHSLSSPESTATVKKFNKEVNKKKVKDNFLDDKEDLEPKKRTRKTSAKNPEEQEGEMRDADSTKSERRKKKKFKSLEEIDEEKRRELEEEADIPFIEKPIEEILKAETIKNKKLRREERLRQRNKEKTFEPEDLEENDFTKDTESMEEIADNTVNDIARKIMEDNEKNEEGKETKATKYQKFKTYEDYKKSKFTLVKKPRPSHGRRNVYVSQRVEHNFDDEEDFGQPSGYDVKEEEEFFKHGLEDMTQPRKGRIRPARPGKKEDLDCPIFAKWEKEVKAFEEEEEINKASKSSRTLRDDIEDARNSAQFSKLSDQSLPKTNDARRDGRTRKK